MGVGRACRQDAPDPADIARATRDIFEDVRRTSADILIFSLQTRMAAPPKRDQSANENLRAALAQAGLSTDDLAQVAGVDARTVRRWLSGGTPYPRQRGKVARALDTTEHDLWPEIATAPPPVRSPSRAGDVLAGYPTASDLAAADWQALMAAATDRIELLGDALIQTAATPGVPEILTTKATHGCAVRILVHDTGPQLAALLDHPGVEIRLLDDPAAYLIHRYDDELLLTLHAVDRDADKTPLIRVRRTAPDGMFDRLIAYYDDLWARDSQPLKRGLALPAQEHDTEDQHPGAESSLPARTQPTGGDRERPPSPPRRWPRRP